MPLNVNKHVFIKIKYLISYRPPLEMLENNFDFVRDCLEDCWAENPDQRPDFKAIRVKLRPMRKGM